ncbi:MAG TPA: hypothetical protein VKU19_15165 [Bryobacteraceae bacterium]|nr:hypothetical protein [Bryobacteraceae bacterium]
MKQSLAWLALSFVSALNTSGQSVTAPVDLYVDFQQSAPPAVVEALRTESESILAPAGVQFRWWSLSDFRSERVSATVVVVHFEEHCDLGGLVMRANEPGSLGWTEISDGTILPFIHVDCARVRTFLQTALLGYPGKDQESIYGRALGRVLAHELYHVFAVTSKHAERGVAKEDYSVKDLLAPDFHLQSKQAGALRASRALAGFTSGEVH